jgi:hypothetical protein
MTHHWPTLKYTHWQVGPVIDGSTCHWLAISVRQRCVITARRCKNRGISSILEPCHETLHLFLGVVARLIECLFILIGWCWIFNPMLNFFLQWDPMQNFSLQLGCWHVGPAPRVPICQWPNCRGQLLNCHYLKRYVSLWSQTLASSHRRTHFCLEGINKKLQMGTYFRVT